MRSMDTSIDSLTFDMSCLRVCLLESIEDEEVDEVKERRILSKAIDKMTKRINKRTEKYGQITKHILIGNRECAQDSALLQSVGVTHVLNICHQLPNYYPQKFIYMKIDVAGKTIRGFFSKRYCYYFSMKKKSLYR